MTTTPWLGCIADDFTGATDLANNLVRGGMRTVQTIGVPTDASAAVAADAIVVALKSRTMAPADAIAQSLEALRWLRAQGVQQVYFKYCSTFDSTAEGNIGPVTDALLDALSDWPDSDFTIACPAFPENQRTVFRGHLFVGDQLLSDSSMRNHPLTPMTDSNLVRVLQSQTRHKVGLVPYNLVAQGEQAIRERFAALRAEGVRIAVVDAVSNDDLNHLGAALRGMALVTAGSGVAIGLLQNWRAARPSADGAGADRLPPPAGLRAVVSGSCSQATNAQVAHFKNSGLPGFAVVRVFRSIRWRWPRVTTWSVRHWPGPIAILQTGRCWSTPQPNRRTCRTCRLDWAQRGPARWSSRHCPALRAAWSNVAFVNWLWLVAKHRAPWCGNWVCGK